VVAPLAIARKLGMPRRILVVLEGEGWPTMPPR
jgi:hypothetical protein